jgi:hypothetical protein
MSDHPEPAFIRDDPFMAGAFASFVKFAWERDDFHEGFTAATGRRRPAPPKNGLDQLIDDATGAHADYMEAFVAWVVREHWGEAE